MPAPSETLISRAREWGVITSIRVGGTLLWLLERVMMIARGGRRARAHLKVDRQAVYRELQQQAEQILPPGQRVPNVPLYTLDGGETRLDLLWQDKPALIVTASFSCGQTRGSVRDLLQLVERFGNQISVAIVYVLEPHPYNEPSPYVGRKWVTRKNQMAGIRCTQPKSLHERIVMAEKFREHFNISVPILVDDMDNSAWHAISGGPHVGLLVRQDGVVAAKQGWFDAKAMSLAIEELL